MSDLVPQNISKTVKTWARIVAKAWLRNDFEQQLMSNPREVLEAEGLTVPSNLDIEVRKVEELNTELLQPQLIIPLGVPFTVPTSLEVKVEGEAENSAEASGELKLVVSLVVSGIKVIVRKSESMKLVLPFNAKPSENNFNRDEIERIAFGLEEVRTDIGGCPESGNSFKSV